MEQNNDFDIDSEIKVITAFLKDSQQDAEKLWLLFEEMKILRKHDMLPQIEKWHEILQFFKAFETDVEINAERAKRISSHLREQATDLPSDWKEILAKDDRWNFDW